MKRRYLQIILAAVLFLLALGLTLYPVVSNYYNQRHQSQIQTAYREVLEQTDTVELKRIREQAVAYNAAITPGAAEEAYSQEAILTASNNYVNQLNVGGSGIMGYINIPKIHVELPIYHGTGSDSLDRGSGNTSAGVPSKDRELASDIGETRDDPPVQKSASMRQGRWLAGPFVQKADRGRSVLR